MAKAMLIMDMPSSCDTCPVHSINVFGDICCRKKDGRICLKERPTWCPLREIPKKAVGFGTDNEYIMGRKDGWNRCVDKILGGDE